MTWRDLAGCILAFHGREDVTDAELDFLLWERTAFPFADVATVVAQIEATLTEEGASA